jgi:hypothetical protein
MDIKTTKLELMHLLLQTKKETLLSKLKNVFEEESSAFYKSDISDLEKRAESSLDAIEKGESRPIAEFKTDVDHWKSKQSIQ